MPSLDDLKAKIETQERQTVGTAFGGTDGGHGTFSVSTLRDWIISNANATGTSNIELALVQAKALLAPAAYRALVGCLTRFSFLIELTNLKVGSTKMKTRWLPGRILMAQVGSFEPIEGTFQPGNDPRSASFDDCADMFAVACNIVCDQIGLDADIATQLTALNSLTRVPYEFPLSYLDLTLPAIHVSTNIAWVFNDDLKWLLKARKLLKSAHAQSVALRQIQKTKLDVKVFKTDRSLTGKDKTNRAKRWEVLPDDFQHATLEQCWSAERQLTSDLACFVGFPADLKTAFETAQLISPGHDTALCPVTLEPLNFTTLAAAATNATHGVSDYQIGHLHPLKRGGAHDGANVRWQSSHGNRIQGDLTINEVNTLLDTIAKRRAQILGKPN